MHHIAGIRIKSGPNPHNILKEPSTTILKNIVYASTGGDSHSKIVLQFDFTEGFCMHSFFAFEKYFSICSD